MKPSPESLVRSVFARVGNGGALVRPGGRALLLGMIGIIGLLWIAPFGSRPAGADDREAVAGAAAEGAAGEAAEAAMLEKAEAAFIAMLTDATLNGTWAPIDRRLLGENQEDGYYIVRAEKKSGDQWVLVSRLSFKGQEFEVPFPVTVKFAGDAAVVILNDVPLGDGSTWSARILFHDDVYAGSWWGADKATKSGIVSGTITRGGAAE